MKGERTLGLAALLAPGATTLLIGIATRAEGGRIAAGDMVASVLAGGYLLLGLAVGPLRRFLADLGAFVAARVHFLLLLVLFLAAGLRSTALTGGAFWPGVTATLLLLTVAAGARVAAGRPARLAGMLALVLVNLLVLVGFDFVVRATILPRKSQNSLYIVHDPDLGWRLRAGFSVVRPSAAYTSRETTNSLGFRTPERPFPKPPGVKRVVVLGDSHTEAYTVNDDETWPVLLERALGGPARVEVIALGVGGFSTDQELLCYARYGRRFEPDAVLLQTAGNDVESNVLERYWRGLKPRFVRHGETLLLTGVPVPDFRGIGLAGHPLLRHSAIALVLDASLGRLAVEGARQRADRAEGWEVTRRLVRDLSVMVATDGAEFALFNATPDEEEEGFAQVARQYSLRYFPLLPAFDGDLAGHRVPGDMHWNAKGHAAVARHLAPLVAGMLD